MKLLRTIVIISTLAAPTGAVASDLSGCTCVADTVDRFITAGCAAADVTPAGQVAETTLVRRLTLDLVGIQSDTGTRQLLELRAQQLLNGID